jgi:feruloyl esterase
VNFATAIRVLGVAFLFVVFLTVAAVSAAPARPASCPSLSSLALPNAMITQARAIAAGEFALLPDELSQDPVENVFKNVPAFCRVAATLRPTNDSEIKIEVWMPASGWNGKFQAVGNGGWAGAIAYGAMSQALKSGYATASTDTGHTGNRGTFALDHPEKLVDFGYRAVHEMTVQSKSHLLLERMLDRRPRRLEGSAALSQGLRWRNRRCSRESENTSSHLADLDRACDGEGARKFHPQD